MANPGGDWEGNILGDWDTVLTAIVSVMEVCSFATLTCFSINRYTRSSPVPTLCIGASLLLWQLEADFRLAL